MGSEVNGRVEESTVGEARVKIRVDRETDKERKKEGNPINK